MGGTHLVVLLLALMLWTWEPHSPFLLFICFFYGVYLGTTSKKQKRTTPVNEVLDDAPASELDLSEEHQQIDDSAYASSDEDFRSVEQCVELCNQGRTAELLNSEITELALKGKIPCHSLEKALGDANRAVCIRRAVLASNSNKLEIPSTAITELPYRHYDFAGVSGCCAENVIGYMPIPIGVAGPLYVDEKQVFVPMGTTEGALIASTSRGCKAINQSGGCTTVLTRDGMTRAPVIEFDSLAQAAEAKKIIESTVGVAGMKDAFESTTRHGKLQDVRVHPAGKYLYLRFRALTGEAMGMNMISKGVQAALDWLACIEGFPDMQILALSGNMCTDKKPAAINWIEGRGKSVIAEAVLPESVVENVLKTTAKKVVHLHTMKNYVGSALAGTSAGGFNAHAANIVTAIFLATGQDAAQASTSSNCLTVMEERDEGGLYAAVTMPSVEVGVVGGGTQLPAQSAMLSLLGLKSGKEGEQAAVTLARTIAATVLAGELSLCCALSSGDLVASHMIHNRR